MGVRLGLGGFPFEEKQHLSGDSLLCVGRWARFLWRSLVVGFARWYVLGVAAAYTAQRSAPHCL